MLAHEVGMAVFSSGKITSAQAKAVSAQAKDFNQKQSLNDCYLPLLTSSMKLRRICSIQLTALVACLATELLAIAADVPHTRKYFYVGGHYVNDTSGGHVMRDQMYVEQLTPAMGPSQPYPIVFIHGFGQTGTVQTSNRCWLCMLIKS